MGDGFLGRWSKRKLDAKEGKPLEAQPLPADVAPAAETAHETPVPDEGIAAGPSPVPPAATEAPPPPTLEDVQALTSESDFKRFAAADVPSEVKNAAMKKLFSDPRYNVMDGMDVYIDDYSKPDPIPYSMLCQLASAKFLGLFDEEEKEEAAQEAARQARDVADNPTAQTVAQSEPVPPAVPEAPEHADPDLRLQQDHAAAGKAPGQGTG